MKPFESEFGAVGQTPWPLALEFGAVEQTFWPWVYTGVFCGWTDFCFCFGHRHKQMIHGISCCPMILRLDLSLSQRKRCGGFCGLCVSCLFKPLNLVHHTHTYKRQHKHGTQTQTEKYCEMHQTRQVLVMRHMNKQTRNTHARTNTNALTPSRRIVEELLFQGLVCLPTGVFICEPRSPTSCAYGGLLRAAGSPSVNNIERFFLKLLLCVSLDVLVKSASSCAVYLVPLRKDGS